MKNTFNEWKSLQWRIRDGLNGRWIRINFVETQERWPFSTRLSGATSKEKRGACVRGNSIKRIDTRGGRGGRKGKQLAANVCPCKTPLINLLVNKRSFSLFPSLFLSFSFFVLEKRNFRFEIIFYARRSRKAGKYVLRFTKLTPKLLLIKLNSILMTEFIRFTLFRGSSFNCWTSGNFILQNTIERKPLIIVSIIFIKLRTFIRFDRDPLWVETRGISYEKFGNSLIRLLMKKTTNGRKLIMIARFLNPWNNIKINPRHEEVQQPRIRNKNIISLSSIAWYTVLRITRYEISSND